MKTEEVDEVITWRSVAYQLPRMQEAINVLLKSKKTDLIESKNINVNNKITNIDINFYNLSDIEYEHSKNFNLIQYYTTLENYIYIIREQFIAEKTYTIIDKINQILNENEIKITLNKLQKSSKSKMNKLKKSTS